MADETFSAKQVARRIGTDAKTFRKWLRSSSSPYPAVGQGKRYEFPQHELHHIKVHFEAWKNKTARKAPALTANGHSKPAVTGKKLNKEEFQAERAARGKARDGEYGTIDGEYPDEPTREELEALVENNELPSDDELEELED
jgi:hypothetical protein